MWSAVFVATVRHIGLYRLTSYTKINDYERVFCYEITNTDQTKTTIHYNYTNAMSIARQTKEGHLKKYRNFLLGWSNRYFKLERSYLHYFEAPYAPQPINSITRGDIANVKESTQFEGKQNVFELHTKSGNIWFLQAESAEEMYSWMRVLVPTKQFPSTPEQSAPSGFMSDNSPQPTHDPTQCAPQWQGSQGPYVPHNTPPMQPGQIGPHFDPRMFAAGGPLYDPRVHGQVPYTPPPPYTEENQPAQPLPSKTGI